MNNEVVGKEPHDRQGGTVRFGMSSGSTPHPISNGNDRAKRSQTTTIKQSNKMEELANVKAYAKELENIIDALDVAEPTRILIDRLVDRAKVKYHMCNINNNHYEPI